MVVGLTPELVRPVPRDLTLCQWPLKGEEKRLAHHKLNPSLPLQQVILTFLYFLQAHCGSVGRVLYSGQRFLSSSLTIGDTTLCPLARLFIPSLVLVLPRKTGNHPDITEKLLIGT